MAWKMPRKTERKELGKQFRNWWC